MWILLRKLPLLPKLFSKPPWTSCNSLTFSVNVGKMVKIIQSLAELELPYDPINQA